MTALPTLSSESAQATFTASNAGVQPKLTAAKGDLAAIRKTAQDFEAVFASQMMQQMFDSIHTDAMFGGGNGEDMFRPMLIDEYGKQIAKHGGLGIAEAVMHTLLSAQEKSQ
jgi:Rod binding domain-containing protein